MLNAPFGAFKIHRASDIDYVNLTAKGISSVTMEYQFESRLPYHLWKNSPDKQGDDIYTRTGVTPTGHGNNFALIMKKVYFDDFRDASKRGKEVSLPQEVGPIWNNTAVKYEDFDTTWYVIEQRSDLDGVVIVCAHSAKYCELHGARASEMVGIASIFVPIADVGNWRDYQELIQEKVRSAIVSVETIIPK